MSGSHSTYGMTSPRRARRGDADTSHAAARRGHERTLELRRRLLEHLRSLPIAHWYATAEELHLAVGVPMGVDLQEVRRRLSDMRKAQRIVDSGHRGVTAHGSPSIAWRAVVRPAGDAPYDGRKER
jgi:2-keto-3-deoxy-galactonokinase